MVKLLLDAGANPNTKMKGGETVLMLAARSGNLEAVKTLLARHAGPQCARASGPDGLDVGGGRRAHRGRTRPDRCGSRHQRENRFRVHAILFAVRDGHLDTVRMFLAAGADVNAMMLTGRGKAGPRPRRKRRPLIHCCLPSRTATSSWRLPWSTRAPIPTIMRTGFAPST